MENTSAGKSPNTSFSFRYNANNEELEELYKHDPLENEVVTLPDASPNLHFESSPKKVEKAPSILDKYFKSMREKTQEKPDDVKSIEITKPKEDKDGHSSSPKDVSSSPMKEYLNRLGKRSTDVILEGKESNETWKIFHDFKFKLAQAVEDMKTRSVEEGKEKSVPRENSTSDSEENSAIKDSDQQSVGDTDYQVSSLESSIQNLSEISHPLTARATEFDESNMDKKSDFSDETHKNIAQSESIEATKDSENSSMLDIESGVEALEDNLDGFGETNPDSIDNTHPHINLIPPNISNPPTPIHVTLKPSKNILRKENPEKPKTYFLHFPMYCLTFLLLTSYFILPNCNIWNGFLLGVWFFYFGSCLKQYILDNYFSDWEKDKDSFFGLKRSCRLVQSTYTIPFVKEHRPVKKYEGWVNHYRYPDYNPYTYHINKTTTAFMKLEGCNLRISYTRTKIAKRALWDENIDKVVFYQHRIYNLTGARVILLPKGLVKKRQWSKKYPICIILSDKEKIQVLEKEGAGEKKTEDKKRDTLQSLTSHDTESSETNTSPEKKKKFVWRKKDKNVPHNEVEPGREGLRHRIVRKMHREKKAESTMVIPDTVEEQSQTEKNEEFQDAETDLLKPCSTDEELDESEFSRILEEAEMEPCADSSLEGEWSVHVKESKDKHSHIYLFGRTGRDKHEWYRRLKSSVSEANASAESSAADDKSNSEANVATENKNGIEMVSYKVSDKEVSLPKAAGKSDSTSDGNVPSPTMLMSNDIDYYEKSFWPYFFKIIQSKSSVESTCTNLPAEVMWLNALIARIGYDVMRDPNIIARVQNRIQRKLRTLKLPSFMSPLVITELSLIGSCPLVERMGPPSWDERGVWIDADVRYAGGAYIAILTQINLMKLKQKNVTLEEQLLATADNVVEQDDESPTAAESKDLSERHLRKHKPAIFDSEVEDSAESSDDDEAPPVQPVDSNETLPVPETPSTTGEGGSSKKKFLRMVDKIATNKYFQQVTDYKYVKRAMEGISNTDIKLHLEVQGLEGRLALNLPPPPHDRVWAGFRTNPQLVLKARPAFGARTLRFANISNWIEQKLSKEFEKVLVLPNMEDIIVDVMTPTPVEFE